jgi:molecular chaperone DnaJ
VAIKDYYKMLEVPRDATSNQIRRAYIKKARQCHPDQNPGDPEAAEKFRSITEAYEVLYDEEERGKYDRMGMFYTRDGRPPTPDELAQHFKSTIRDFFSAKAPNSNGDKIEDKLEIAFEDVFSKQKIPYTYTREIRCIDCDGFGGDKNGQKETCSNCQGSGKGVLFVTSCATCAGQGFTYSRSCKTCHGDGRDYKKESILVPLPDNITVGKKIRIKNKGHHGYGTGDDGDLILTVHFQKHEFFERRGSDLFCNLPTEWSVAVLGGTIEIPTLEGSSTIRIPSGTQSQKIIRLSGRGLPIDEKWTINSGNRHGLNKKGKNKRGDIHYTIQIEVPINITPAQRKALQQLQKEIKASTHPKQYTHITEFQMYMQKRHEERVQQSLKKDPKKKSL